ncbi:MAG: O-antigen ligase family protein [Phycisphaerales bacterium]
MNPLSLIVAAALLVGLVYCVWRPQVALVAVVLQFPIEQLVQSYFTIALRYSWLVNAVVAGLVGIGLLSRITQGKSLLAGFKNPVTVWVMVLFAQATVGLLWSPGHVNGADMMIAGAPYLVLMMILAPMLVSEVEEYQALLVPFMITGSVVALLIFVNPNMTFYAGRMTIELAVIGKDDRGSPLALADAGGMLALVAVLYAAPRRAPLLLALRVASFLLGMRLAIVSGSRGQVIAAIACGLLFYPVARRIANMKQFVGVTIGVAVLVLAFYVGFRLFVGYDNESRWGARDFETSVEERSYRIKKLLTAYMESPGSWPFGLGTNALSAVVPGDNYVHNFFVEVLCEQGLVGVGVVGAILWTTFASGRRLWRMHPDDRAWRATVAVLGAQSGFFLLLSMKQGTFISGGDTFMYWLFLGKIARSEQLRAAGEEFEHAELEEPELHERALAAR